MVCWLVGLYIVYALEHPDGRARTMIDWMGEKKN